MPIAELVGADYQVAFPVPGHGSSIDRPQVATFTDHDLVGDVTLSDAADAVRVARGTRSDRDEFTFQRADRLSM